jgi:hypothetical protein
MIEGGESETQIGKVTVRETASSTKEATTGMLGA